MQIVMSPQPVVALIAGIFNRTPIKKRIEEANCAAGRNLAVKVRYAVRE